MDALVVGGGPSGLAAAYRLKQAGRRVRVLEAADRPGGELRTTRHGAFVVDQGAYFLPTTHERMLAIARETGIADELVPGGFVLATARDGAIHELDGDHPVRDLARTRMLSTRSKLALAKLAAEPW